MSIYIVLEIPNADIDGPPGELLELLSAGSHEGRLLVDGMAFDGDLRQISVKWPS